MRLGFARRVAILVLATETFLCARSYAQTTNATVTGQVTDQS